jgi:predicted DsbA family dithiol-disulfide isomerase
VWFAREWLKILSSQNYSENKNIEKYQISSEIAEATGTSRGSFRTDG